MDDFKDKEQHPIYAMLSISRSTCGNPQALFGSSILHNHVISLQIAAGNRQRGLSNDWYFRGPVYIEVEMSPAQFAEAITSLNAGSGVPVTLTYLRGEKIEPCPFESTVKKYENEFRETIENGGHGIKDGIAQAKILLENKSVSKADLRKLIESLEKADRSISSGATFIYKQFNERMEKTVSEAKGEIEGFLQSRIASLSKNDYNINAHGSEDDQ